MAIKYYTQQIKKPLLKYRIITGWLKNIIKANGKITGELTFIFCTDNYLRDINIRFLNHDYFTDIITFDYVQGIIIAGDIYISCDSVYHNSVKFGVNLEEEFLRVICHGVLHLLGLDDKSKSQKKFMRETENNYILLYRELENGIVRL